MARPPRPAPPEVEIEGIVAYTTFEERQRRRENFARLVFMPHGARLGQLAHTILIPKVPDSLSPEQARAVRQWFREVLPTCLYPGGRLQYENMEDQCRVLMGQ